MAEVRPADLLELGALQRQVLTAIRFAARTAISVSPGVVRAVANHERPVIARERSGGVGAPDVEPGQSSRTRVELPMLCTDPSQFNGRRRVGPCSTSTFGELRQVGFTASPQQCCRLGRPAAKAGGKLPRRITDGPSQQIAKARNTVVPERYPGHVKDRDAAHRLLAALRGSFSTIRLVWADGGYPGRLLIWAKDVLTLTMQIIKRIPGATGFHVRPRIWVVERSFAWINKHRRCVRDYETRPDHHEAMVHLAMITTMTRRLART